MQVILLSGRGLWRVRVGPGALAGALAVFVVLLAAAFHGGFRAAMVEAPLARNDLDVERRALLLEQQRRVDVAVLRAETEVAALAARTARLQAGMDRIDALGAQLVAMLGVDPGEYSFHSSSGPGAAAAGDAGAGAAIPAFLAELRALDMRLADRRPKLRELGHHAVVVRVWSDGEPRGRPVQQGWVSSAFGWRGDPLSGRRAFHDGIDLAGRYRSPVLAVADGVVTVADRQRGYGNLVEIRHPGGLSTRYAHNERNLVAVGDRVARGDVVALMGSTGRSTGAHVHFEVLRDGAPINPWPYLRARG